MKQLHFLLITFLSQPRKSHLWCVMERTMNSTLVAPDWNSTPVFSRPESAICAETSGEEIKSAVELGSGDHFPIVWRKMFRSTCELDKRGRRDRVGAPTVIQTQEHFAVNGPKS